MLAPAIWYKGDLEYIFEQMIYDEDYFYFTGKAYGHSIPEIKAVNNNYQYAIIDEEEGVIGYLEYQVEPYEGNVHDLRFCLFENKETYKAIITAELKKIIELN
jgi:hypothetical protein